MCGEGLASLSSELFITKMYTVFMQNKLISVAIHACTKWFVPKGGPE